MRWLYPNFVGGRGALGLLLLRLAMGSAFILHGWPKVRGPQGWPDIQFAMHWMENFGMPNPPPPALQAAAAASEIVGGILLILGLLTPLAALGIAGTMAGALHMVHLPAGDPFVNPAGRSFEPALVYLAAALMFLLVGPGTISLDGLLFGRRRPDVPELVPGGTR
jgi:putative oxidoreductase